MRVFAFSCEPDGGDDLVDAARVRVEAGEVAQLLGHGHHAGLAARLQHDAEPRLPRQAALARVDAEHAHLAARAVAVALEDLDRRGLAGAVRPEQREGLAAMDVEAHAVDGVVLPVVLAQVAHAHDGFRFAHALSVAADARHPAAPDRVSRRIHRTGGCDSPPAVPPSRPHSSA